MVFALEPKFVLPGLGAIGIEDTWLVTAAGVRRSPRRRRAHPTSAEPRRLTAGSARTSGTAPRRPAQEEETWSRSRRTSGSHRIDAEGFPTVSCRGPHDRRALRHRHAHAPAGHAARCAALLRGARRRAPRGRGQHAPSLGPRVRQRRLPGADIVAQRACPRLITAQMDTADESMPLPPPEGVPLPTITFGDRLTYADRRRERAPDPHARAQRGLARASSAQRVGVLFGGDTRGVAAAQLPAARRHGGRGCATLRQLKQLPVDLSCRRTGRRWARRSSTPTSATSPASTRRWPSRSGGRRPARARLPAGRFLPEGVELDETYHDAHRANLMWAWDEV